MGKIDLDSKLVVYRTMLQLQAFDTVSNITSECYWLFGNETKMPILDIVMWKYETHKELRSIVEAIVIELTKDGLAQRTNVDGVYLYRANTMVEITKEQLCDDIAQ